MIPNSSQTLNRRLHPRLVLLSRADGETMQRRVFVSHSALFYPLLSSLSLSTLFLCRDKKKKEKKIMRKEAERRLREQDWGREIRGGGALECSCNQGLCAQEGPINPAVCLYISSGILKAAKNESPGPGGLLGAAERESERATGGFGQESVITAAEDTSHDRPESLSCSRPGK